MIVDAKHHRYFVAKRGEVLRNIGEEFGGVVVSFPRPGVTSDKVKYLIKLNKYIVPMYFTMVEGIKNLIPLLKCDDKSTLINIIDMKAIIFADMGLKIN